MIFANVFEQGIDYKKSFFANFAYLKLYIR